MGPMMEVSRIRACGPRSATARTGVTPSMLGPGEGSALLAEKLRFLGWAAPVLLEDG